MGRLFDQIVKRWISRAFNLQAEGLAVQNDWAAVALPDQDEKFALQPIRRTWGIVREPL